MIEWQSQFTDMSLRFGLSLSIFFNISIAVYIFAVTLFGTKLEVKTRNHGHVER